MAATALAKAMDERAMEEKAIGISGIMDIASNPAKDIGNAEAIELSTFSENVRLNSSDKRSPWRPFFHWGQPPQTVPYPQRNRASITPPPP
jgi:hypothetical protein